MEVSAGVEAACKRPSRLSAGTILGTPWRICGRDWRGVWRRPASRSDDAAQWQRRRPAATPRQRISSCRAALTEQLDEHMHTQRKGEREEGRNCAPRSLTAAPHLSAARGRARRPTPAAAVQGVCPTSRAAHCSAASASKRLARPGLGV